MAWQFFWDLVLVGVVVLFATRVAVALERDPQLSTTAKWAILIGIVLAGAFFLSLFRAAAP
jgi:hypothetical protein